MFEDIVWLLDNSLFYGVKEKLRRCCEKKLTPTVVLTAGVSLWGRVDSNHRTHPRTDLQSVAIAAMRLPLGFALQKYIIF